MSSKPKGPPKHQNKTTWKANANVKKNDKELGGKLHPFPAITGVCPRCKSQIEWRRKYGKYKALSEPAKCNQCTKRAVRQAYHALCTACARERNVCAKCCRTSETIVGKTASLGVSSASIKAMLPVFHGDRFAFLRVKVVFEKRDAEKQREEQQMLEQALRNLRERDRRTLLRTMNNGATEAKLKRHAKEESLDGKRKMSEDSELEDEDECESSDAADDGSNKDDIEVEGPAANKLQLQHLDLSLS
ncbi:hypothetical protein L7F22_030991 [Adiantum nelumboides]|nr:hypothetical protein [Adiantum nelumboides]